MGIRSEGQEAEVTPNREAQHPHVYYADLRKGDSLSYMGRGLLSGGQGVRLVLYTAQDHLEAPLEVPSISQWCHYYSGFGIAQTAGTKTLPHPYCDMNTCSHRGTHTQPPEPPSHRLSQELTWTLGCRPTGRSAKPGGEASP